MVDVEEVDDDVGEDEEEDIAGPVIGEVSDEELRATADELTRLSNAFTDEFPDHTPAEHPPDMDTDEEEDIPLTALEMENEMRGIFEFDQINDVLNNMNIPNQETIMLSSRFTFQVHDAEREQEEHDDYMEGRSNDRPSGHRMFNRRIYMTPGTQSLYPGFSGIITDWSQSNMQRVTCHSFTQGPGVLRELFRGIPLEHEQRLLKTVPRCRTILTRELIELRDFLDSEHMLNYENVGFVLDDAIAERNARRTPYPDGLAQRMWKELRSDSSLSTTELFFPSVCMYQDKIVSECEKPDTSKYKCGQILRFMQFKCKKPLDDSPMSILL